MKRDKISKSANTSKDKDWKWFIKYGNYYRTFTDWFKQSDGDIRMTATQWTVTGRQRSLLRNLKMEKENKWDEWRGVGYVRLMTDFSSRWKSSIITKSREETKDKVIGTNMRGQISR